MCGAVRLDSPGPDRFVFIPSPQVSARIRFSLVVSVVVLPSSLALATLVLAAHLQLHTLAPLWG